MVRSAYSSSSLYTRATDTAVFLPTGGKGCLFHSDLYKKIYFYSTFCKEDLLNFFVSRQKNPGSFGQQKHQPIKRLVFLLVGW